MLKKNLAFAAAIAGATALLSLPSMTTAAKIADDGRALRLS